MYTTVRIMAARYWTALMEADRAELKDWDPSTAEQDPKLNREQQATVAVQMALSKVKRAPDFSRWAEARLEAMVNLARAYSGSTAVRDELIPAALDVAPEVAGPILRELYPDDPTALEAIKVIAAIGQPFEFELATPEGRSLTAADFRGKVTLLFLAVAADHAGNEAVARESRDPTE